jgi:superfamily I DNA and/or RNA helicase
MHRAIMAHPSEELYEGRLEAAPEVAEHVLSGLAGVREAPATTEPLWFVDTSGCGYAEAEEAGGDSRENPLEAEAVARHVEALMAHGVDPSAIGVITPYSAQVRRLRDRLSSAAPALEVDTVDGFQGREKEAIVISLVRSNERGEVGFLSDVRRINVAFTRARRHLAVFGDGATVGRDPFIRRWIERCAAEGAHRSAWELGLGELGAGA